MLQRGGRQEDFSEYFVGVYCSNMLRRALKKADRIVELYADPGQHQKALVSYFLDAFEMVKGEKGIDLDQLAFLVLQAHKASKRNISKSLRKKFEYTPASRCYICGKKVFVKGKETDIWDLMELEHIWPQCYGGDSDFENLLPSCHKCNNDKGDLLLWQNASINKVMFRPDPPLHEMATMGYVEKIARHRQMIFDYASKNGTTLKCAALEVGSVKMQNIEPIISDDAVDYYNFKFV
tara:strand:- start:149 stop:856 length:708 start_codon:yes stop_codon:yes gene_type:complete